MVLCFTMVLSPFGWVGQGALGIKDAAPSGAEPASTDLASANLQGLYEVGDLGAGFVAGYMTPVPLAWQDEIGAPYLTGQAVLPIIGRTSAGPAAFGFDPADLGSTPAPTVPLVSYPLENPLAPVDTQNIYFNLATQITGIAFPEGSQSVLFFGRQGLGPYCYGTGEECNDPVHPSKGEHAYPYVPYVWAYDVADLLSVKSGEVQPWEVRPDWVGELPLPYSNGSGALGGVSYGPATQRLFVSQQIADAEYPVIHVFKIPDLTAPTVSITSPSIDATVGGLIPVSADAEDNVGLVGVQFFLDGAPLGSEDTTAPYSVSWDTTTVVDGLHLLSARARDAAGNQSISSEVPVTVLNTLLTLASEVQSDDSIAEVLDGFPQAADLGHRLDPQL